MKAEYWTIAGCAVFFAVTAPIYWWLTYDPTGTTALVMTFLLCALLGFYLGVVAKQIPDRPEDRSDGEIAEGAGEQGFFPPYSWWPMFCAMALAIDRARRRHRLVAVHHRRRHRRGHRHRLDLRVLPRRPRPLTRRRVERHAPDVSDLWVRPRTMSW